MNACIRIRFRVTEPGNGPKQGRVAQAGSAMIFAMGLLAAMSIGAAAFFALLQSNMKQAKAASNRQVCLSLAEAGVHKAVAELRLDAAYRGERDTPLGDGFFTVEVIPGGQGAYAITGIGFRRPDGIVLAQARIEADVARASNGAARILNWKEVRGR